MTICTLTPPCITEPEPQPEVTYDEDGHAIIATTHESGVLISGASRSTNPQGFVYRYEARAAEGEDTYCVRFIVETWTPEDIVHGHVCEEGTYTGLDEVQIQGKAWLSTADLDDEDVALLGGLSALLGGLRALPQATATDAA